MEVISVALKRKRHLSLCLKDECIGEKILNRLLTHTCTRMLPTRQCMINAHLIITVVKKKSEYPEVV